MRNATQGLEHLMQMGRQTGKRKLLLALAWKRRLEAHSEELMDFKSWGGRDRRRILGALAT